VAVSHLVFLRAPLSVEAEELERRMAPSPDKRPAIAAAAAAAPASAAPAVVCCQKFSTVSALG
jgi:hypothetical protein